MANIKRIKHAAIPRGNDKKAINSLTTIAETLIGAKGDTLEKAVTFRDLQTLDLVTVRNALNGGGLIFEPIEPGDDEGIELPTKPTNFTATGGFTSILLRWDYPSYTGHAFTEIWRSETNVLGEAALLVGTNSLNYSDIPGNNFTGYYWARHVNTSNQKGPFHATSGELGETAEDVEFNISVLNGKIAEVHLNSYLSDRVDLIQLNKDAADALNDTVTSNKQATDAALNTITTVTIPAINALFPNYATLAYANSEFLNQAEVNSAISGQIDTFYTSIVQEDFVTSAFLQNTYRTESDTDSAIAQALTSFLATTIVPDYATTAFITQEYRTEADTDSAISTALTNFLSTTISPTYATSAFITSNYRTETNTNTAISTAVTGLRSEIFNGTGNLLQSAFVNSLDSAIANANGSIATSLTNLSAAINDPVTGLAKTRADVTSNYNAVVNDTGDIISQHIASYSVTVDGVTNTLSEWAEVAADADANFVAQWGFKTSVNDLVGGVGFYNDGSITQFTVQSDRFAIIDPRNDQVKSVFATVVNDPVLPDGVYIDTAFIKAATIAELVAGDINADTVTAGISIDSPEINGGKITGSTVRALQLELLGPNTMFVQSPAPFGPNNLIEWKGEKIIDASGDPILSQLTKTNATYWYDENNDSYQAGSILAGTLGTSNQDASISNSLSTTTGAFVSNGGQIAVKVSASASFASGITNGPCPTLGTPTIVVQLKNSAGTVVKSETFTGGSFCDNEGNGQTVSAESVSGSFTYFDNLNTTSNRTYTATAIVTNVRISPNANATRGLSIVTQE